MKILILAAFVSTAALAEPDGGTLAPANDVEEVRREVDRKVEAAKKEMRDEIRQQVATQSVAQGWQEEWVERNRKLELFELSGYFRVRPDLFNKFDFMRSGSVAYADPDGYTLWPSSPIDPQRDRTATGANMRFRLEPTLNVSEEVRIKMQVDVLDNVVFGSTPDYAFSRQEQYQPFGIFSNSQNAPVAGLNSNVDSLLVKRVWGEVSTPVGILKFGRMGSNWGLGLVHNDGSCIDCDHGETVDRVMFVAEPYPGWFVTPMFDVNVSGLTTSQTSRATNAPQVLANNDAAESLVLAIARRDTDQQAKAKIDNGLAVLNYGIHFTYRTQRADDVNFYDNAYPPLFGYTPPQAGAAGNLPPNSQTTNAQLNAGYVSRFASLFLPDLWVKYERKAFRIEAEFAAELGSIQNRSLDPSKQANAGYDQSLSVTQFGGAIQGEYRILDGTLGFHLELGYASGDNSPGLGNFPNRQLQGGRTATIPGDLDGPQYACQTTGGCTDNTLNNFRFASDYRIDEILFRELLGGVTDALYLKPKVTYQVADGFHIFAGGVVSRAQYAASTASAVTGNPDPWFGVELNAGAKYETEDGFFVQLTYAIFFPLGGFNVGTGVSLDNPSALRGLAGIKF